MTKRVSEGNLVSYKVAAFVLSVSPERLAVRPDDKDLVDSQIDFREEDGIVNSDMNPEFREALIGMELDDIKSIAVTYQAYDVNSLVVLPVSILVANGFKPDIEIGTIIGLDVLKNQVRFDEHKADLEVIALKEDKGEKLVVCDSNEWNAGLKVRYDIEIIEIKEPTAEDVAIYALT